MNSIEGFWRIDLHMHSIWSFDAYSSLPMIMRVCKRNRIDAIALTDHNEIEGALQLEKTAPFVVIAGEEISTSEGEVIALCIGQRIPPGMSLIATVRAIKEQGGLVYLPHPFETIRKGVSWRSLEMLGFHQIDVWEIFNARSRGSEADKDFREYSAGRGLRFAAGSDAHTPWEIGRTYTLVPPFETPQELITSLEKAQFVCVQVPFLYRLFFNYKTRQYVRDVYLWKSGGLS